jgi:hypothetical protein
MAEIDEVRGFAKEFINHPATRTAERRAKIQHVIRKLTGKILDNSCGTCYIEALITILNLSNMASSKYELKKGVLLEAFGHPEKTCTALTITDELGDWYMANYPQKAIYFARLPQPPAPIIPQAITVIPPKVVVLEEVKKTKKTK